MVAHGQPSLLSANHSTVSTASDTALESTTANLVDTTAKLAKDVGEMLKSVPYVKAVAGIISQIITIRDEINTTEEQLHELIDKVLRRSSVILQGLLSVERSPNKEMLTHIESRLQNYRNILSGIFCLLQETASKDIFQRIVNRKSRLGDLEKYRRLIDDYNTDFLTDLLLQAHISGQPQESGSSAAAPPFVFKPVLPPAPQLMIGRDQQKSEVIGAFLDQWPARIAILGAGGMGKTTLALSVLHEQTVADRYPSRSFISCEGTPSVLSLIGEIANALRLPLANRDVHLLDTILSSFPANSILCLDNFETLWDNEPMRVELGEFLSHLHLPHLGLIITMRGTQRPSKVSWSKPLLTPLKSLTGDDSRRMFEQYCSHPLEEFVEKLLNAVDVIPLAISLICSMLDEGRESSESLWSRWMEVQSRSLENGGTDRLSNLDTSIRLSVEGPRMRADPKTIDILAMLSMLPDGFSDHQTAKEDLKRHLPAGYSFLEALRTIRRVSLVHVDETGESPRLRMLNPVRAFCEKTLVLPEELRNSITSHYVEMIGKFWDYTAPNGHAIIPSELNNLYVVLMQAWKAGKGGSTIARASILFTGWSRYLGNPVDEVISFAIEGVMGLPELMGDCNRVLGEVYYCRGRLDDAEASFNHATQLHRQAHSVLGEANDIQNLGRVYLLRNRLDDAEASFNHAVQLHRQAHDALGEANDIQKQGEVYLRQNRVDEAETSFERATQLHRQSRSVFGEAYDIQKLGEVYLRRNRLDDAEASFERAIQLHRQSHSVLGEAYDIGNLGKVYLRQDRLDDAEASFKRAAELHRHSHDVIGEATDIRKLGEVYLRRNMLDDAEASFEHATQLHRQSHSVLGEANDIQNLGKVYLRRDRLDDAEASFEHAAQLHRQSHSVFGEANDVQNLGQVYLCQDRLDDAETSFKRAAHLHRQAHSVYGEANNIQNLGEVYLRKYRLDDAEAFFTDRLMMDVLGEVNDIGKLGEVYLRQYRLDEVEASCERAAQFYQQLHDVLGESNAIQNLGKVYLRHDRLDDAEASCERGAQLHRQAHDVLGEANNIQSLGAVFLRRDRL
ncbi:hypothetical protein H0H87_009799 [Tephrocybe sp. NHM501043]|nr:hypothetical protein H0H87_009799 [Tephrocybe sp. NHM501043]